MFWDQSQISNHSTINARELMKTTCKVGRSMKMCRSNRPGLIRALSNISALLVEARTITWSVVPIPAKEEDYKASSLCLTGQKTALKTLCFTHHPSPPAAGWESAPPQCWRSLTCCWSASFLQHQSHQCRPCKELEHVPPWTDFWPLQHQDLHTSTNRICITPEAEHT